MAVHTSDFKYDFLFNLNNVEYEESSLSSLNSKKYGNYIFFCTSLDQYKKTISFNYDINNTQKE